MSAGLSTALQTAMENNMDVDELCWEMMRSVHPRLQRPKYEKIFRSIYEDANKTRSDILFLHFFIDKVLLPSVLVSVCMSSLYIFEPKSHRNRSRIPSSCNRYTNRPLFQG